MLPLLVSRSGRLNHISIKLDKCVLHVLNIYGPAQQDERVNFYNHLNEYCRSINNNTDKYIGVFISKGIHHI
jgi:hypothetical protein